MEFPRRKRWQIAPPAPQAFLDQLSDIEPLVAQLLYNRGFTECEDIEAFLNGGLALDNPFIMKDIGKAVTLIRKAIVSGWSIVVYGDYDADGVTAAATLVQTLQALGAHVLPYIPNRADEGYGLNVEAITALAEQGARMLITVDCGIRSLDEIAAARQLGMTVIVTDHHHLGPALPAADAVINPKREDCDYPFQGLAGVGVAFKLAQALLRVNQRVPLPTTQADLEEDDLLDLVTMGTVADMVPLLDENHALVLKGLAYINAARRPGISALMAVSKVQPGTVTADTISFILAPRLNAAGRIGHAMTALDLLLASDMSEAIPLAEALDDLNRERRSMTMEVYELARSIALRNGEVPPLLFAALKEFPSGVVGLAASRLSDEFYRPAVVLAIEGEFSKGSARSIAEFHITDALDAVDHLLERHGGHAAAAGFTVRTELLPELEACLTEMARKKLQGKKLAPTLAADAEVALGSLSWDTYYAMQKLQPFGFGNPAPLFVSRKVRVAHARAVGAEGRHLKLYLADECGKTWDAIAFRHGDWLKALPQWIDIAYEVRSNAWRGNTTLQLRVQDIHFDDK